jgi:hypothetical protein
MSEYACINAQVIKKRSTYDEHAGSVCFVPVAERLDEPFGLSQ